jgi:hypothetical protein
LTPADIAVWFFDIELVLVCKRKRAKKGKGFFSFCGEFRQTRGRQTKRQTANQRTTNQTPNGKPEDDKPDHQTPNGKPEDDLRGGDFFFNYQRTTQPCELHPALRVKPSPAS